MKLARTTIARFALIVRRLRAERMRDPDSAVPAHRLATELEVCPKTVYRDMDFLRDRLLLPIDVRFGSIVGSGGFYLTQDVALCACCLREVKEVAS